MKTCALLLSSCVVAALVVLTVVPAWAATCGDTAGPGGTDVPCSCGDTAVTDTLLVFGADPVLFDPADGLVCPGPGLLVGASGITLDLGGNAIVGCPTPSAMPNKPAPGCVPGLGGTGDGVRIENASGVTVRHGTIRRFRNGIVADATTDVTVESIKTDRNVFDGIAITGADSTVTHVRSQKNGRSGIDITGGGNELAKSDTRSNGAEGVKVVGNGNTVERVRADRNGVGILADGTGNELSRNRARYNAGDGIVAGPAGNVDGDKNRGHENGGVNCVIDGAPCR